MNRQRRYLETISSQVASLSISNITKFYVNYIKKNYTKVESELKRVGYFVLKNKLSIGKSSTTTKDVFISTYFINVDEMDKCNYMISQKYYGNIDIRNTGGFFIPSTNELVIFVKVDSDSSILEALEETDIRSTIEHELTHAFDSTSKNTKVSKQNHIGKIGREFISACMHLGCVSKEDWESIIMNDALSGGMFSEGAVKAISLVIYKLFTITEFNAHLVDDFKNVNNINIKHSEKVKEALSKDIVIDYNITRQTLDDALFLTAEDSPYLWRIVGNVLSYMGYNVDKKSPEKVYNFFKKTSIKLFKKYINKKMKNKTKQISSLKEKESIKNKIINSIVFEKKESISFWYSPSGIRDSFLFRVEWKNDKVKLSVNREEINIYGNANEMLKRAMTALKADDEFKFEFAIDNLVDIIIQSIERKFTDVKHDPIYDITEPQDEETIEKSNKIASRFDGLDWD